MVLENEARAISGSPDGYIDGSGVMTTISSRLGRANYSFGGNNMPRGVFGYSFGNRLKLLRLTPEPKPISFGIAAPKERLSPVAEKFWQCAKEAVSKK